MAMGEGENLIRGRAKPSPGPPGCRGPTAYRWKPSGDRRRGERAEPPLPGKESEMGEIPDHVARNREACDCFAADYAASGERNWAAAEPG